MTRDHMMGFTQPAENFDNPARGYSHADWYPKEANQLKRIKAEQAEARGNRSHGLCTSGEQYAYVQRLVWAKFAQEMADMHAETERSRQLREAIARKAAEPADERIKQPAQPAVVVDEYRHLRDAIRAGKTLECGPSSGWTPIPGISSDYKFGLAPDLYRIKGES